MLIVCAQVCVCVRVARCKSTDHGNTTTASRRRPPRPPALNTLQYAHTTRTRANDHSSGDLGGYRDESHASLPSPPAHGPTCVCRHVSRWCCNRGWWPLSSAPGVVSVSVQGTGNLTLKPHRLVPCGFFLNPWYRSFTEQCYRGR